MPFSDIYGLTGVFIIAGVLFYYLYRTNKRSDIELQNLRNMDK